MNESCLHSPIPQVRRFTHMNVSWFIYIDVMSLSNERVMCTQPDITNAAFHTYGWVTFHKYISHVSFKWTSHVYTARFHKCGTSHTWISSVSHTHEQCLSHMDESCPPGAVSEVQEDRVQVRPRLIFHTHTQTHTHTYEWVTFHIYISHVSIKWMSHVHLARCQKCRRIQHTSQEAFWMRAFDLIYTL